MSETTSASSVAQRLYYDSPELSFRARVTDIRLVANQRGEAGEREQLWQVALDRTAFYPEGGGQPSDTGLLVATARSGATLEVPVERVEEDGGGEVWHFVRKPLVEATEVEGHVDAARRMDHAQQHSGQHLLSAVFLAQLGARTVSFHLGADTSTIDLALPEGVSAFAPGQMAEVEDEANRLIYANRPLHPRWHSREEAEAMLARGVLRKLPDRSGPLRVVEMQGIEFNACGGTHVASTGAIGGLLLRRLEKVKQGWRVDFVCGLRAVRLSRSEHVTLSSVAQSLSVITTDVPARVNALAEENKAGVRERRLLLEELAEGKVRDLLRTSVAGEPITVVFADKPVEFGKRVALEITRANHKAVIGLKNTKEATVLLAVPPGDGLHAGTLLREVCAEAGTRGGGSAEMAQAVCSPEQTQSFVSLLSGRVSRAT